MSDPLTILVTASGAPGSPRLLRALREADGRQVRLAFVQRLRDERKFPDVEALKEQIAADVRRAARLFDRLSV